MRFAARISVGTALVGATLVAIDAGAQTFGTNDRGRYESRQDFAFEIRFGPYVANIDQEFRTGNGTSPMPYQDYYGAGPNYTSANPRIMGGIELDWQAVRLGPVGSLGAGLGASFVGVTENAPITSTMTVGNLPVSTPSQWTRSSETTTLFVVPITAQLVLRLDGIARRVPYLPFVPYVKFGLACGFWWVTKGPGNAQYIDSSGHSQNVAGYSMGWTGAIGLALLLDRFEPQLARQFDSSEGVNHSYLFVEGSMMDLSGFLGRHQLNVGTNTWTLGLALEF